MPSSRDKFNVHSHIGHWGNVSQMMNMEGSEKYCILEFVEQPVEHHRFRYDSEYRNGSHGCLTRRNATKKKLPPVVRCKCNYEGNLKFRCSLYTHDCLTRHCHKLLKGSDRSNIKNYLEFQGENDGHGSWKCDLKQLNLMKCGKDEYTQWFYNDYYNRYLEEICGSPQFTKSALQKEVENKVRLYVEAVANGVVVGHTFSDTICHQKGSTKVNIIELSKPTGCYSGKEELIILTSKLNAARSEICFEFYEENPNGGPIIWADNAEITLPHHGVAFKIKPPKYRHDCTDHLGEVKMRLKIVGTNECSEPRDFTYIPSEEADLRRKRARIQMTSPSLVQPVAEIPTSPQFTDVQGAAYFAACGNDDIPDISLLYNFLTSDKDQKIDDLLKVDELKSLQEEPISGTDVFMGSAMLDNDDLMQTNNQQGVVEVAEAQSGDLMCDGIKGEDLSLEHNGHSNDNESDKYLAYKLALHTAQCLQNYAKTGNINVLLMSMRHLVALQDEQGDNAIHSSVIHAQNEALRNLVEVARTVANYDILNMVNELNQAPLHIAVQTEQVRSVKILLYHGANPNLRDRNGNSPIHLAAQLNMTGCLTTLLETKSYTSKYKSHTPNLDIVNYAGYTPLHLAVLNDCLPAVECLCFAGCDVNSRDRTTGRTALHMAVERNNLKLIDFLLNKAYAETDIQMFSGNTPLHLACLQGHLNSVSLLMEAKADPYIENYEIAQNEDDEDSEPSLTEADVDIRGLTSIDLASSDKMRSLLRREPVAVESALSLTSDFEEHIAIHEEVPVKAANKAKNNNFDSGIVLSGMDLSSGMSVDSAMGIETQRDKPELVSLGQILDQHTQDQLARILDPPPEKWRDVVDLLEMLPHAEDFARQPSPTKAMLNQIISFDMLEYVLEVLALEDLKDVVRSAKPSGEPQMTQLESAHLESKFGDMKL